MNKEKFLMDLREYLSILENQEQEDILAEYAQHIDMKMRKGLSEEEAIRDFGPMRDLAAEILEAYHVKPEFRKKGIGLKLPGPGVNKEDHGGSVLRQGLDWTGKKLRSAAGGIRNGFRWLVMKCRAAGRLLIKPFAGGKRKTGGDIEEDCFPDRSDSDSVNDRNDTIDTNDRKPVNKLNKLNNIEGTGKRRGRIAGFCKAVGHGMVALWKWFLAFCVFWLKFMWNAAWMLFGLFCACLAMITLMGVCAIPVLLVQGYPFVGIFLICVGGLLCLGTLSWGAFSMMIRKKKDMKDEDAEKYDEEVPYEQTA